jgi:hypothetical protein
VNGAHRFYEVCEDDESFHLPPVIRRMTRFDGDEGAATSGANFVVSNQFALDDRAIVS